MKLYIRKLHGPTDWGWITQQTGIVRCADTDGVVIIDEDTNTTVAAYVLELFMPNSCRVHFACTASVVFKDQRIMETVADFIFNQKGMKAVYGYIRSNNERALKRAEWHGFTELTRLKNSYEDGIDQVVLELLRENCEFYKERAIETAEEVA